LCAIDNSSGIEQQQISLTARRKMIAKIILSLITGFLFTFSIYLIVTDKKIEGTYYDGQSGWGWVHNSFNGYLLLIIAIGFLIALIFIFKGKKINL